MANSHHDWVVVAAAGGGIFSVSQRLVTKLVIIKTVGSHPLKLDGSRSQLPVARPTVASQSLALDETRSHSLAIAGARQNCFTLSRPLSSTCWLARLLSRTHSISLTFSRSRSLDAPSPSLACFHVGSQSLDLAHNGQRCRKIVGAGVSGGRSRVTGATSRMTGDLPLSSDQQRGQCLAAVSTCYRCSERHATTCSGRYIDSNVEELLSVVCYM